MEWMTTAVTTCMTLFTTILDTITSNAVLSVIFAGGTLIPLGFKIFRKFKRA